MFVTTSYQPDLVQVAAAQDLAQKFSIPYIQREHDSLSDLFQQQQMEAALVVTKKEWRYETRAGDVFHYHPNMSVLRIKQLKKGNTDPLVEATQMKTGDHVLDCTLGMGADALLSSYVVGAKGKVIGLESQQVIAELVSHGLQTYATRSKQINDAMRRIAVIHTTYQTYLAKCSDDSFDWIFFDPMFRQTVGKSTAMQSLKKIADPHPLDILSVTEAIRVARKAVLLKERRNSDVFEELGFQVVKQASNYAWGMIRKNG